MSEIFQLLLLFFGIVKKLIKPNNPENEVGIRVTKISLIEKYFFVIIIFLTYICENDNFDK